MYDAVFREDLESPQFVLWPDFCWNGLSQSSFFCGERVDQVGSRSRATFP